MIPGANRKKQSCLQDDGVYDKETVFRGEPGDFVVAYVNGGQLTLMLTAFQSYGPDRSWEEHCMYALSCRSLAAFNYFLVYKPCRIKAFSDRDNGQNRPRSRILHE